MQKRNMVQVKGLSEVHLSRKKKKNLPVWTYEEQRNQECYGKYKKKSNKDINLQKETLKQAWICRLFEKRFLGRENREWNG